MDINAFLNRIAMLESSGGRNVNHQPVTRGVNAGQTAIGAYGMMPATIQETINRAKMSGRPLPEGYDDLDQDSPQEMHQVLDNNPNLQKQLASDLAQRILSRTGGNDIVGAYMWTNGQNLNPNAVTTRDLVNSPYAQKYNKLASQDNITAFLNRFVSDNDD